MSPRKLTEDDKKSMLELYRNSKATTSTLATDFGVSSSTVSRFLKNSLSQEEYEELIQQKRLARTPRGDRQITETVAQEVKAKDKPSQQIILPTKVTKDEENREEPDVEATTVSTSVPRRRRHSPIKKEVEKPTEPETEDLLSEDSPAEQTSQTKQLSPIKLQKKALSESLEDIEEEDDDDVDVAVAVAVLSEMLGEEIEDDEVEDDEVEDDEVEDDELDEIDYPHTSSTSNDLEILPLSAASFPRTCYLVVDRAAELIVKPLQEFADLGTIPDEEIQQKTLPVFDNHRIAKRFSHRREKVIKVPDGKMLQKTSQYLYEKGITRLLIRGQIYAISKV